MERNAIGFYITQFAWKTELAGDKKFVFIFMYYFTRVVTKQHLNGNLCAAESCTIKKIDAELQQHNKVRLVQLLFLIRLFSLQFI